MSKPDIDSPYPVTEEQIVFFRKNGFIKLKNVLSPEAIEYYREEITTKVHELNPDDRPVEEKDLYGRAFLQIINVWKHSAKVEELMRSKRLARIATELLEVDGVRLHHDQALYKEPGGGYTPWHVDQFYWPLTSDRTVTAWFPLHAAPVEMGALSFSPGSQRLMAGRELIISEESEKQIEKNLKLADFGVEESPYDLGEVSFHLGYNFHRAGPNHTDRPREVMTIAYMDKDMRLAEPKNQKQRDDIAFCTPGAKVGEIINGPANPILYP